MSTALDIIKSAYRLLGVYASGETPSSEDSTDALATLNMLIGSWNNEGLMIYQILDETFTLVDGTSSYNIGSSQTFDTTRPIRIDSAFIRDSANSEYGVSLITSQEYNGIGDKTLSGIPNRLYYNAAYPAGVIYLWPVPDAAYTLGLSQWKQLSTFAATSTDVSLPQGYEMALRYALAKELAPEFGKAVTPDIIAGLTEHKAAIMRINNRKPAMRLDRQWTARGSYDVYSDQYV